MEDNMKIWDALKKPPPEALKEITGGRLSGKTDINPQWRYKAMTEQFGICGVGWKYIINKLWLEPVGEQVCAFAEVGLSIMVDSKWSDTIPGVGGSMILAKESSGLHVSDECYKMAITDALSVAMKMIGVAADVYAGFFDGVKYSEEKKSAQRTSQKATPPPERKGATSSVSAPPLKNRGELFSRAAKFGLCSRDVLSAIRDVNPDITTDEQIVDFDEAWIATAKKFASTIKSYQEATKALEL